MKTFNEYMSEDSRDACVSMVKLAFVVEHNDDLNEGNDFLSEDLSSILKAIGLHDERNDGLISYLAKFSAGAGRLIIAAVKGDKKKVSEIANSMSRSQFVDFLLKIDVMTLHLLTGPIHMIDALTGWEVAANIHGSAIKGKDHAERLKKVFGELKKTARSAFKKHPNKFRLIQELEPIIMGHAA